MQFSFKLIAAAAFFLPNLIVARVVSNDAVAKREAFASPEAEALSNFEIARRDFRSSIEAAQVKRDAYADAIAHVESITGHQLMPRGQVEDQRKWDDLHTAYKAQSRKYDGLAADYKKETDKKKREAFVRNMIAALEKEIEGREKAQKLLPGLIGYSGWDQKKVDGHAGEIKDKKACLAKNKNAERFGDC